MSPTPRKTHDIFQLLLYRGLEPPYHLHTIFDLCVDTKKKKLKVVDLKYPPIALFTK